MMPASREPVAVSPSSEASVTIAIPFFAGREHLRKAIESVLRQTNPRWELLICDDHSLEPDLDVLIASYADARCRYVRNPANLGMAGNWNRCLDLARTDLVTLLHADDELHENYCALMAMAARRYPDCAALFCEAVVIGETGAPCFSFADFIKRFLAPPANGPLLLRGPRALAALLRGNFIFCPTLCYRKGVLGNRRFSPDWRFVLDLEFYSRLLLDGDGLVGMPTPAYAYRRHSANTTLRYEESLLRFREEVALYDILARRAAARGWTRAARLARGKAIIKFNLLYGLLDHVVHRRWRQAWRRLAFLGRLL
jgi:glycosyltransferase involved in cell wall biosynthesis